MDNRPSTEILNNTTTDNSKEESDNNLKKLSAKRDSSWPSVLFYIHLNILGLYGILVLCSNTSLATVIFTLAITIIGIIGVTCGAHRLWAHHTYTADLSLRIFLMLCQTMAGHGTIYEWVKKHRLHHQTFKTNDDPYYSDKNFLHAQVFTQLRGFSERQETLLKKIDVSDLEADGVVMFQKRFYWILYFIFFILLPINAPLEYWDDTVSAALFVTFSLRYLILLNITWLVNSAHFLWGLDTQTKPSDSNLIFVITKSYWPLYHYLIPFDYQSGEFGSYGTGCSTAIIRVFAALGLATNLQTMTTEAVKNGLTKAIDTARPVAECLAEVGKEEMKKLPNDFYLDSQKYY